MTGQPPVRLGALVAAGWSAVALSEMLARHGPDQLVRLQHAVDRGDLPAELVAEFRQAWRDIRAAALAWTTQAGRGAAVTAVDGTETGPSTAMPSVSTADVIDTDQAAGLLHVTPNRVRQLLRTGNLAGRKTGRTWWVSMDSVKRHRGLDTDGRV